MTYEIYRNKLDMETFFSKWDAENIKQITEELKHQIYAKYLVKAKVFTRDNFQCQNTDCEFPKSELTLHHVKFKKNGGMDKVRNCITLCKTCHMGYHKAKRVLTFSNDSLPAHLNGHTFQLKKEEKMDWKQIREEMNKLRKTLKSEHGILLSAIQIKLLIRWLTIPYNEWDD